MISPDKPTPQFNPGMMPQKRTEHLAVLPEAVISLEVPDEAPIDQPTEPKQPAPDTPPNPMSKRQLRKEREFLTDIRRALEGGDPNLFGRKPGRRRFHFKAERPLITPPSSDQ